METSYLYVHDKFRHLVTASDEERITFLDEPRWIGYGVAKDVRENLVSLMNKPKRPIMKNLLVVGDSNSGKTTLIRRFYDLFAQPYVGSQSEGIHPVILINAPNTKPKDLYISLLECFCVPFRADDSVVKLRSETISLFKEYKVKMLIMDQFHSLLIGESHSQHQVMNAIKTLCDELQIPFVGVGNRKEMKRFHANPQHNTYFDVITLPVWKCDREFQQLLYQFQSILPLKKCSNLQEPAMAKNIHAISNGNIGNVHRLLTACAVKAITTGTEQITSEIIMAVRQHLPFD